MLPEEWANALDIVRQYVVQIKTPRGYGTGFLIASSKDIVGIATALHVVSYAEEWQQPIKIIHLPSKKTILLNQSDRSIHTNIRMDSALIRFRKSELPLPDEPLHLPAGKTTRLREGVEVGWCGYPVISSKTLCFFSGRISAWLKDEASYLVDGVAINGVSGGPAFDVTIKTKPTKPVLIGLVTAYIANRATGEPLPGVSLIRSINPYLELFEELKGIALGKGGVRSTL